MPDDQAKLFKTKSEIVGRLLKLSELASNEKSPAALTDSAYFGRVATACQMAKSLKELQDILKYYGIVKVAKKE